MNEITRKPAQTVAQLASARQHQKTGRPSWSARWRVRPRTTLTRGRLTGVAYLRKARGPDLEHTRGEREGHREGPSRPPDARRATTLARGATATPPAARAMCDGASPMHHIALPRPLLQCITLQYMPSARVVVVVVVVVVAVATKPRTPRAEVGSDGVVCVCVSPLAARGGHARAKRLG